MDSWKLHGPRELISPSPSVFENLEFWGGSIFCMVCGPTGLIVLLQHEASLGYIASSGLDLRQTVRDLNLSMLAISCFSTVPVTFV